MLAILLLLLLHGVVLALLGRGFADAVAQAIGGGATQESLACWLLLGCVGLGFRKPLHGTAPALFVLAWSTALGLCAPQWFGWLATWTAGPAGSATTLAVVAAVLLLGGWPAYQTGRLLAARLPLGGGAGLEWLLLGLLLGWSLSVWLGLGTIWLLAAAALGVGVAQFPRPQALGGPNKALIELPPAERPLPPRASLLAATALGILLAILLPFLGAHLRQFDGGSWTSEGVRWLTLGACAWIGVVAVGGPFSESRRPKAGILLLTVGLGFALIRVHDALAGFAGREAFRAFSAHPRLTLLNSGVPLDEDASLYLPLLTGSVAFFAAFLSGALLRMLLGIRGRRPRAVAPDPVAAYSISAFALVGLTWTLFLHPAGVGNLPTGIPFRDVYEHHVLEATPVPGGYVRRVSRSGPTAESSPSLLARNRNLFAPPPEKRSARRAIARWASDLDPRTIERRFLYVGLPDLDAFASLQEQGRFSLSLVCDPAAAALAQRDPRLAPDARVWRRAVATPSEANGPFHAVLVHADHPWLVSGNPWRGASVARLADQVAERGQIVFALDPEFTIPGMERALYRALERRMDGAAVVLLPFGWETPWLLVVGWNGTPPSSLDDPLTLLLRTGRTDSRLASGAPRLTGPLPQFLRDLAATEFRIADEGMPSKRAALVLASLQSELPDDPRTLLPFYAAHLSSQLYTADDTLLIDRWEQIDIATDSLDALLELSRASGKSAALSSIWAELAPALVMKREVEWIEHYFGLLTDEGWDHGVFWFALAMSAREMLDDELFQMRAQRALAHSEQLDEAMLAALR